MLLICPYCLKFQIGQGLGRKNNFEILKTDRTPRPAGGRRHHGELPEGQADGPLMIYVLLYCYGNTATVGFTLFDALLYLLWY